MNATNAVSIPLKKLEHNLPMPAYAYSGDAGVDLRAAHPEVLEPFQRKAIPCGIALAIPQGYAGFVLPRSGLALRHGISLVNAPGLIDSNFRGEIKVILVNLDPHTTFSVSYGDRIAQLVISPVSSVCFVSEPDLSSSCRGEAGFGSSGIKKLI